MVFDFQVPYFLAALHLLFFHNAGLDPCRKIQNATRARIVLCNRILPMLSPFPLLLPFLLLPLSLLLFLLRANTRLFIALFPCLRFGTVLVDEVVK